MLGAHLPPPRREAGQRRGPARAVTRAPSHSLCLHAPRPPRARSGARHPPDAENPTRIPGCPLRIVMDRRAPLGLFPAEGKAELPRECREIDRSSIRIPRAHGTPLPSRDGPAEPVPGEGALPPAHFIAGRPRPGLTGRSRGKKESQKRRRPPGDPRGGLRARRQMTLLCRLEALLRIPELPRNEAGGFRTAGPGRKTLVTIATRQTRQTHRHLRHRRGDEMFLLGPIAGHDEPVFGTSTLLRCTSQEKSSPLMTFFGDDPGSLSDVAFVRGSASPGSYGNFRGIPRTCPSTWDRVPRRAHDLPDARGRGRGHRRRSARPPSPPSTGRPGRARASRSAGAP